MGWTAGSDIATGNLVTSAMWNNYLGASGSLEYLKTEADKLDDCTQQTQADFSPDRVLGTVYQNGAKTRVVSVACSFSGNDILEAFVENDASPSIQVDEKRGSSDVDYTAVHFIVPPNWYYEVDDSLGNGTIRFWTEWDLH